MPRPAEITYDPETGKFWRDGKETGRQVHRGYRNLWFEGKKHRAHRVAWFLHYGEWPDRQIDHINGDRQDNRILNLRLATGFENQQNRGANRNNTSGFKGVSWHGPRQKWRARIDAHGKMKHLGYFTDLEDAARAYQNAALRYHGKFANLDL